MEDGIESVYGVRMTLVWMDVIERWPTIDYRLSTIDYRLSTPPSSHVQSCAYRM